jgi:hypothetical protein
VALNLTIEDVTPFLSTLNPAQTVRVGAWIPVLSMLLDKRYGDRITTDDRVLFVSASADALERRLSKPAGMIDSQSIGSASVKYNARAALARWFLPEELDQLDDASGLGGGIRSVRASAPDGIRFGNSEGPYMGAVIAAGIPIAEEN